MLRFHHPWMFLLVVPLAGMAWLAARRARTAPIRFSSIGLIRGCPLSFRARFRWLLLAMRLGCVALLVAAMARPRTGTVISEVATEGVAIEAAVDRSGSMQAEMAYQGSKFTKLDVVKQVLGAFIKGDGRHFAGRAGDLVGLVTFARYADTICPLVHAHDALLRFLEHTKIVELEQEDGTAIGDAIALAAARLHKAEEQIAARRAKMGLADPNQAPDFKIRSKVIILLTDGRNNAGQYHPLAAAELAGQWGIKIYTIGIGSGQAYATVQTLLGAMRVPVGQDLDEDLLKAIAAKTGGFYARADDVESLVRIVKQIDDLEKTAVRSQVMEYAEAFKWWAWPALVLLLLEILAGCTVFRKIP